MENGYDKVVTLKLAWTALVIFLFIDITCIQVLSPQPDYEIFEGRDFYFCIYLEGFYRLK